MPRLPFTTPCFRAPPPAAPRPRCLPCRAAFDPYRSQHFANVSRWAAAGYQPDDTSLYLATAYESFNHGNVMIDLRVPGTKAFRWGGGGR